MQSSRGIGPVIYDLANAHAADNSFGFDCEGYIECE
jgi:hypothetical protein